MGLINKHLPVSTATLKGHMRKGLRSSRSKRRIVLDTRQNFLDTATTEYMCTAEEDEIFCFAIIGDRNDNTIYSNLTGRFPVQLYKSMEYILVVYVYKLNPIYCAL